MNLNNTNLTYFDTPFRSTEFELKKDKERVFNQPFIIQVLEGFPNLAVVLNSNRQIIAYNKKASKLLFPDQTGEIYGRRLGEALNCIHAFDMPAGCGTSKFCSKCGAGKCNKLTKETHLNYSEECRITTEKENYRSSLDLRVFTTELKISDANMILFSIEDIKDEKRRKVLEKIFFHDVLNTAAAIQGFAEILNNSDEIKEVNEFSSLLLNSSDQLINEIQFQRDLQEAEQGSFVINIQSISANKIIRRAYNLYNTTKLSKEKNYICEYLDSDVFLNTDSVLLIRSIGNLIKNALEASDKNEQIKVYCEIENDHILFYVQNDKVIPEEVQLQLFQRSFSTKASKGRGIGTYSVKLFVEQYLNGFVDFVSNYETGTLFSITLPIN